MQQQKKLDFNPFQTWRYDPRQVDLARVIAPPYDVISPAEQDQLYEKSPWNVVRLILNKEDPSYDLVVRTWREWTKKGILIQEPRPAIYLYEQAFTHPWTHESLVRRALVGRLQLNAPEAILGHEATFSAPKKDRLLLLEKTRTNLSPLFGIYQEDALLSKCLAPYPKTPPLFEVRDGEGTLHRGWAIDEEEDQKSVSEALAMQTLLIADGHHRYETALEYRRRMREKFPKLPPRAGFDFVMIALVASTDPALLVLPTHRILRGGAPLSEETFKERFQNYFDFSPCSDGELFSALERQAREEKVLGVVLKSGSFVMRLKDPEGIRAKLAHGKPTLWYEIEANLLAHFVLPPVVGLGPSAEEGCLDYVHAPDEAIRAVRQGGAQAAFLLRSVGVDTIRELVYAGERMPQKTTYFYPKLASGLFFYHHE